MDWRLSTVNFFLHVFWSNFLRGILRFVFLMNWALYHYETSLIWLIIFLLLKSTLYDINIVFPACCFSFQTGKTLFSVSLTNNGRTETILYLLQYFPHVFISIISRHQTEKKSHNAPLTGHLLLRVGE